ncbi:protein Aster-B isoform X9 [Prionailurus viverrinus]|uniref:protein Aster-B isoform X9 n=1 Tax=Prionailurus viverrinus TaxID=61388 RepID=UPI001FF20017|nr:protein Aster-B isoform X9 [Prionailurus viverrinus]
MPAANMLENLQPPALQVPEPQGAPEGSPLWSSSSTPTLRRRRFKMRRMKNVQEQSLEAGLARDLPGVLAPGKEFLQLPSIEITPSSDEDTPWSNCSTPSASPRRKRFLLRKWLRVRERKECSESSHYYTASCWHLWILAKTRTPSRVGLRSVRLLGEKRSIRVNRCLGMPSRIP